MELISIIYYMTLDFLKMYLLCFCIIKLPKTNSKKTYLLAGILLLIIPVFALFLGYPKYLPLTSIAFVSVSIIFLLKNKRQIAFVIIISISTNIIDSIISGIAYRILGLNPYDANFNMQMTFFDLIHPIVLLSATLIIRKYKQTTFNEFSLKPLHAVILVSGFVVVFLFMDSMLRIAFFKTTQSQKTNAIFTASISVILFIAISVFTICTLIKYYNKTIETLHYKKQVESQQKYYEALLEREEDTQAFRHDIINHMTYIMCMQKENEIEKANKYLHSLVDKTVELNHVKKSGNKIIDIVINDIFAQREDIVLDWQGIIPSEIKMDDMDLTALFYNVLSNAVEAVDKIDDTSSKRITVNAKTMNTTLMFVIKNPYCGEIKLDSQGYPMTTKADKFAHGYGGKNIRRIVNKYYGMLSYDIKEIFIIKVTLFNVF